MINGSAYKYKAGMVVLSRGELMSKYNSKNHWIMPQMHVHPQY